MGDLIDRQAAIDALDRIFDRCEEIEAHLPEDDPDRTGYKMFPDYMIVWKYLHQLPSELGTNLAEVGTEERTTKGFPIDADLLMMKVDEQYGDRARDRIYQIIRYMPKYEHPPIYSKKGGIGYDNRRSDLFEMK